jgi:hypothetical protein
VCGPIFQSRETDVLSGTLNHYTDLQVCTSSNGDEFTADEAYDAGGARVAVRITPTLAGPMKV